MASYKVPQNVEADDKLLGPFSFRQFIYLIVAIGSIAIAWVLSQIFLPLFIIPAPVILLFGALALPLKKDQPMETYLAAIVSFYLKPRKRLWDPDGQQSLIEITAPRKAEKIFRGKDITEDEANQRFSYLANIVDSQGWAVRGVASQELANTAMNADAFYDAQQADESLTASVDQQVHTIDQRLQQSNQAMKQNIMQQMQQGTLQAEPVPQPVYQPPNPYAALPSTPETVPQLSINPYPTMHQSVIQPASQQVATQQPVPQPVTTSATTVSPDIIKLANNSDLSIETIAHEANRIKEREIKDEEVVISLR